MKVSVSIFGENDAGLTKKICTSFVKQKQAV